MNIKLNRTICPNVSMTSRGTYRCRVQKNGKLHTTYTTSLNKAKAWVKTIKGIAPKNLRTN